MIILFMRTLILYFFSVFVIRLMGKRQIGELLPHELVMTFMISDLASMSMQDMRYPLLLAILPMVTLLVVKVILTEIELKSPKFRNFIDGKPVIIIQDGRLNTTMMKKQKLDIHDILEEIRGKGVLDINEIEYAILENDGDISIFPKDRYCTIQKKDLSIITSKKTLPIILVFNGKIQYDSLERIEKDDIWLKSELGKKNIHSFKNIFLVILTSKDDFYIHEKE